MSAIRQIEVNGTTYDIAMPGSDLPFICETYVSSGSEDNYDYIASVLHDKHYEATGTDYTYIPIETNFIFLRTQDGSSDRAIVFAVAASGS